MIGLELIIQDLEVHIRAYLGLLSFALECCSLQLHLKLEVIFLELIIKSLVLRYSLRLLKYYLTKPLHVSLALGHGKGCM